MNPMLQCEVLKTLDAGFASTLLINLNPMLCSCMLQILSHWACAKVDASRQPLPLPCVAVAAFLLYDRVNPMLHCQILQQ